MRLALVLHDFPWRNVMLTVRKLLALPLMLLVALAAPAFADTQHAVDPGALSTIVGQRVAQHDADRAAIREALGRQEVRDIAARMGLDLGQAAASLNTLSGSDLSRAGDTARQLNQQLVGGASTVTLQTTTIIIILLVVILIVVLK
jgi:hypothetical protein